MREEELNFSKRLKKFRLRAGLTTREVAEICHVAESTYREWEYGREIRGIKAYAPLAKAFQVSITELILGDAGLTASIQEDLLIIEEMVKKIRTKL